MPSFSWVLHPVKASAIVNGLYISTAFNRLYAAQERASANEWANRAQDFFQADADLAAYWDRFADGKWVHLMDQTHIGYTTWSSPADNVMPETVSYTASAVADLGVAIEGQEAALPHGTIGILPTLSSENTDAHAFH